jgi:hypothetical protein
LFAQGTGNLLDIDEEPQTQQTTLEQIMRQTQPL